MILTFRNLCFPTNRAAGNITSRGTNAPMLNVSLPLVRSMVVVYSFLQILPNMILLFNRKSFNSFRFPFITLRSPRSLTGSLNSTSIILLLLRLMRVLSIQNAMLSLNAVRKSRPASVARPNSSIFSRIRAYCLPLAISSLVTTFPFLRTR